MKFFLAWFPRLLVVVYAIFISLFAADAFGTGRTAWQELGDFIKHLVPTAVTLILLLAAWRHRLLGGLLFIVWGLVFTIHFGTHRSVSLFMMFSLPLLLAGFLFLFSQLYANNTKKSANKI
jgi:hypothetical protein